MKGNAGECQGNVREWRQSARGMQGNAVEYRGLHVNARGTYGSGCKVPGECWGMQGNAGNAKGKHGRGCKVPGEYRGMPVELMGVGAKSQGNAGECRGIPGE